MMELLHQYAPHGGLIFFFSFFVGVVLWLLRPNTKETYDYIARIPLNEDNQP